jgi:tetratricopeptide (TPR) repeat protein
MAGGLVFSGPGRQPKANGRWEVTACPGRAVLDAGRFLDGLQAAQHARAILPNDSFSPNALAAETHLWLAKTYLILSKREAAGKHLDSALYWIGTTESGLRYSIETQFGAFKREEARIQTAIAFFKTEQVRNPRALAEAQLALGVFFLTQKEDSKAIETLLQSLTTFQGLKGKPGMGYARCLQSLGYYYWKNKKQYERALDYFEQAEAVFIQLGGPESNHLSSLYVNMGACIDDLGEPRKALDFYRTAERNFKNQDTRHPNLVNVYNNIGNSYGDLGEYELSIQYLEKALELAEEDVKSRYWNNLGDAYLGKGDDAKAEQCFNTALSLLLVAKKPPLHELARPYHNLAIIYRNLHQIDKSLEYELRSIPYRKSDSKDFLSIARSYLGAGECYFELSRYPEALLYLDSALSLQAQALPSRLFSETADAFAIKAKVMAAQHRFEEAIVMLDSALYACGYHKKGNWNVITAPRQFLSAFHQKAALYFSLYDQTRQETSLLSAILLFDTAAQAVRYFRNTLLESESRAVLAGQFRDILSGGVKAALAMHQLHPDNPAYLNQAFAFSEQSKALVLLEGVRSAGALKFEGISDSLLDLERTLRQAVTDAEVGLRKLLGRGNGVADSILVKAKSEVFDRQRAFESFQRTLASGDFAQYYNFRYGLSLASPAEIQDQLLQPQRTLVSYFLGKKGDLFAFVVQKKGAQAIQCPAGEDLAKQVQLLREGLLGYYTLPSRKRTEALFVKTLDQYIAAAQSLYKTLIAPLEPLLSEEVVIVPDGVLSYVPFELLLIGAPKDIANFAEYPYWFKQQNRSVSYAYSATLLREMAQKQHRKKASKPLLAMAPFFPGTRAELASTPNPDAQNENRKGFNPLVYSGQEVRDIGQICESSDWWIGKEASKQLFLRDAPDCQILHLSTHGVLDSAADYSYWRLPDRKRRWNHFLCAICTVCNSMRIWLRFLLAKQAWGNCNPVKGSSASPGRLRMRARKAFLPVSGR